VLPLTPSGSSCVARPDGSSIPITTAAVSAGFFETMGIDIVAGRSFESDSVSVDTVIVNETLARRLWPSGAAIGERVMIGCEKATSAVVSGVARNSAVRSLGEGVQPHIYVPFAQQYSGGLTTILVETSMPAPTMVDPVRRALLGQGQGIRVYAVRPLEEHVHESYWPIRWEASVLAAFGLLGLVLAAIGLYGVIAYRVALRTREIGVRMALGASREEIFRHVLGQGLRIVVLAVVIGELLAAVLMRAVGSLQTGVRPAELSTHLATIAIWVVIALLACYWPAARATRVDPLVALRTE
jgi:predicted lysophospholipase L1 biosynthesis ABC-type transport system permease subunit